MIKQSYGRYRLQHSSAEGLRRPSKPVVSAHFVNINRNGAASAGKRGDVGGQEGGPGGSVGVTDPPRYESLLPPAKVTTGYNTLDDYSSIPRTLENGTWDSPSAESVPLNTVHTDTNTAYVPYTILTPIMAVPSS